MTTRPKKTSAVKVAVGLLLIVSCAAGASWFLRYGPQAARRHWKNDAIPAIASWAADKNWRAREIEILTNRTLDQRVIEEGWLTDKMILMSSGEWLVYKS